ncbi:MAG: hypothetical protein WD490_08720 [Opitutales bacterium]
MTAIRNYALVTAAFLILLYEFFGIVTNLIGRWIGACPGLKITLLSGLIFRWKGPVGCLWTSAMLILASGLLALLLPRKPAARESSSTENVQNLAEG